MGVKNSKILHQESLKVELNEVENPKLIKDFSALNPESSQEDETLDSFSEKILKFSNSFYHETDQCMREFKLLFGNGINSRSIEFLRNNELNVQILYFLFFTNGFLWACTFFLNFFSEFLLTVVPAGFEKKINTLHPVQGDLEYIFVSLKQNKVFLNNSAKLMIKSRLSLLVKKLWKNMAFDPLNDLDPSILDSLIDSEDYEFLDLLIKSKRSTNSRKVKRQRQEFIKKVTKTEGLWSRVQMHEQEEKLLIKILDTKCLKLAVWIVKYNPGFLLTQNLIKHCINQNHFMFLKWLFKSNSTRVRGMILSEAIFFKYIKQLDNESYFLFNLNLLYSFRNERLSFYNIRIMTEKFTSIIEQNKMLLLNCLSPFVAAVMISDLFLKLSRVNMFQSIKLEEVARKYRELALLFQKKIDENLILKYVLLTDFFPLEKKRPLIEILFEEREYFIEILTNSVIVDIFKRKWYSSYRFDLNILAGSSALSILDSHDNSKEGEEDDGQQASTNKGIKSFLMEHINIFKFIPISSLANVLKNNHIFQYNIYIHSIALRIFIEFIFFLIIFVLVVYSLMNYLVISEPIDLMRDDFIDYLMTQKIPDSYVDIIQSNMKKFELWKLTNVNTTSIFFPRPLSSSFLPVPSQEYPDFCYNFLLAFTQTQSFYDDYVTDCLNFTKFLCEVPQTLPTLEGGFYLVIFLGSFPIIQIIYYYLLHRKFRFTSFYIVDMILFGCGIFCLNSAERTKRESISKELFRELTPSLKMCCTLTIFLLWIKFISYIKMTQSLGVLIKIIYLMFKDVSFFMIIVGLIYLSFASIFFIMYQSYYLEYSTFWLSLRQMIGASMGGFLFYMDGTSFNQISSSLLTIFFMIVTNIVLLNLLIAILSNTYAVIISRSNIEYAFILYDSYKTQKYNKYYGALQLYPPPLSGISFILLPFIIFFKSEKLNHFILKLAYLAFFVSFLVVFNILNILVAIPLAYFKMILRILIKEYIPVRHKMAGVDENHIMVLRMIHLIIWLFLGIPYLLKTHFTHDLFIFCKSAFMKVDNREKLKDISPIDYRLIKNIYRTGKRENLESITKEEFYHFFTENLVKAGLVQEEKQDVAKAVDGDKNNLLNSNNLQLFNIVQGENEKMALELEIMEAKNYIKNFTLDGQVRFSVLGRFFDVIKMKKKKTLTGVKKYPFLLEIANLDRAKRVCDQCL